MSQPSPSSQNTTKMEKKTGPGTTKSRKRGQHAKIKMENEKPEKKRKRRKTKMYRQWWDAADAASNRRKLVQAEKATAKASHQSLRPRSERSSASLPAASLERGWPSERAWVVWGDAARFRRDDAHGENFHAEFALVEMWRRSRPSKSFCAPKLEAPPSTELMGAGPPKSPDVVLQLAFAFALFVNALAERDASHAAPRAVRCAPELSSDGATLEAEVHSGLPCGSETSRGTFGLLHSVRFRVGRAMATTCDLNCLMRGLTVKHQWQSAHNVARSSPRVPRIGEANNPILSCSWRRAGDP